MVFSSENENSGILETWILALNMCTMCVCSAYIYVCSVKNIYYFPQPSCLAGHRFKFLLLFFFFFNLLKLSSNISKYYEPFVAVLILAHKQC